MYNTILLNAVDFPPPLFASPVLITPVDPVNVPSPMLPATAHGDLLGTGAKVRVQTTKRDPIWTMGMGET